LLDERHRDQRQSGRGEHRGECTLEGATAEERGAVPSETGHRGGDGESAEADEEHPSPAEVVGEPAAE
jgi:hypothetical protein